MDDYDENSWQFFYGNGLINPKLAHTLQYINTNKFSLATETLTKFKYFKKSKKLNEETD